MGSPWCPVPQIHVWGAESPPEARAGVGKATRTQRRGPGPAQRDLVNRVRSGRKQLSAGPLVCRRVAWSEPATRPAPYCVGTTAGARSACSKVRAPRRARASTAARVANDGFPGALPQVPTAAVRRARRAGAHHHRVAQRRARRPCRPRVPVLRPAGERQDDDRSHPCQGGQLPRSRRRRRALRCVRELRVDRGRHVLGPHRDGRGLQPRHRRRARPGVPDQPRSRGDRQAQGVPPRRGPHADPAGRRTPC